MSLDSLSLKTLGKVNVLRV